MNADVATRLDKWPADEVEEVGACPVCAQQAADLLFSGLRDRIFHVAPGSWDMQRCRKCGSAFLDPRPTVDSIYLAYENYHTHQLESVDPTDEIGRMRWLKRAFANGYKNWRYGTSFEPATLLGIPAAFLLSHQRAIIDREFRHLPRTRSGRVLDVGFGDGRFLDIARQMGWEAVGTDFDPVVVDNAKRRGLDARAGTVDSVEGPFDWITLSHTIEHFHDPVRVIKACFELLAPGGTIWIETPNVDSMGLRKFGMDWRGLEPPRHLVMFSRQSLRKVLEQAGFVKVRDLRQPSPVNWIYRLSALIQNGRSIESCSRLSFKTYVEAAAARLWQHFHKDRREFIAVMARKAS